MNSHKRTVPLGFFLLFLLAPSASAAIIIDDFTSGPVTYSVAPGEFPAAAIQSGLDAGRVLFGMRTVQINGVQGGTGNIVATVDTSATGQFYYDASGAASGGLIETMRVGAGDSDWFNPLSTFSVDLTAGGNDRLAIEILEANIVPRPGRTGQSFSVRVVNGDPGMRQAELAGTFELAPLTGPTTIYIPFPDTRRGIAFDKVAYVEVAAVNLQAGTSFRFGSIRAVPEPGTVVLSAIAAALVGICPRSSRRKAE